MKLKTNAFAMATAVTFSAAFFIASLWIYINIVIGKGTGETIIKFNRFFLGYDPSSFIGVLLGLFWAFLYMYIAGYIFAWLYNSFVTEEEKPAALESAPESDSEKE